MNKFRVILPILIFICLFDLEAQNKKQPVAPTPPMGWNSWNWFGKNDIDEKLIVETIDAIACSGLKDAGYKYVVVDGGWRDKTLGEHGELLVNLGKFPHGMKYLADYAHSKGLKFGLHTVPGTHDCGCDKVGGLGHEEVQLNQFVSWGIDFIKLDRCRYTYDENPNFPRNDKRWNEGWKDTAVIRNVYKKWYDLIQKSKREILFSASVYEFWNWYPEYCQMGRTTGDIRSIQTGGANFFDTNKKPKGHSVMAIAEINNKYSSYAGNGYWNDPDILVVGSQGLTINEQKIHFALWCIMSAPLMLGNDVRNMNVQEKDILLNKDCIEIDQDPTEQGVKVLDKDSIQIWHKKLKKGNAFLLINLSSKEKDITLNTKQFNIPGNARIKDVYLHKVLDKPKKELILKTTPVSCHFLLIR